MAQSTHTPAPTTNFEKFRAITDNSLVMIYGPTRAGKSFLAIDIAMEALSVLGPNDVHYIDSEKNVTAQDKDRLGKNYRYMPDWNDLKNFCMNPPKGRLLILDSLTLPILGLWALKKQAGQGQMMQELQAAAASLKMWTAKNDGLCIIVGQDKSELSKFELQSGSAAQGNQPKQYWQDPFGGKMTFFIKEIFRLVPTLKSKEATRSMLMAHDCRRYGRGASIADLTINNKGLSLNWRVNPASAAPAPVGISENAFTDFKIALSEAINEEQLDQIRDGIPWTTLTEEQRNELKAVGAKRRDEIKSGGADGAPF